MNRMSAPFSNMRVAQQVARAALAEVGGINVVADELGEAVGSRFFFNPPVVVGCRARRRRDDHRRLLDQGRQPKRRGMAAVTTLPKTTPDAPQRPDLQAQPRGVERAESGVGGLAIRHISGVIRPSPAPVTSITPVKPSSSAETSRP